MKYDSLRDYLDVLDSKELLSRVEGADWNVEIGAVTEVVAFSKNPRALLFDSIKDYRKGWRVATDLFVSERLQAIALGLPENVTGYNLVKACRKRVKELKRIPPQIVSDGPVKENIVEGRDVDILKFPVPKWHEYDPARYFGTGDAVITKDPVEGWVNLGAYRCMVHDSKTLGLTIHGAHHGKVMMEKYWAKGEDAPVVIIEGQDPYLYCGSCTALPWGYSELEFAGGLKEEGIKVIIDEETDIPIPAEAEIAVIGHVPPPSKETREEGPFGECTGYYTGHGLEPVIHIDRIWHRNDPILQGNPPMRGAAAKIHALGGELMTCARIWDVLDTTVPNIKGVYSLFQSCQSGSGILAISLKQSYAGHAKQAALVALGSSSNRKCRAVIVVDEDVDPSNVQDVLWAWWSRCIPSDDIDIVRGIPATKVDPAIAIFPERLELGDWTNSTMIIDACRKPFGLRDKFPRVNIISDTLKSQTITKWGKTLGLT